MNLTRRSILTALGLAPVAASLPVEAGTRFVEGDLTGPIKADDNGRWDDEFWKEFEAEFARENCFSKSLKPNHILPLIRQ